MNSSSNLTGLPYALPAENGSFVYLGKKHDCIADNAVDPDVAGIGVIISFLAAAALTFVCIIVGWFQNAIPGSTTGPVDFLIKDFFCRLFWRRHYIDTPASNRAQEAFENFVLAFSDQQLVTGFALLVSAYFKGDITVYSFRLASSLAWFSSTIHLATLVVLKRYLREHKLVRIFRVVLMLAIAGLLLASQAQSSGVEQYAPWAAMHCVDAKDQTVDALTTAFITIWLVFAFINRITRVSITEDVPRSRNWFIEKLIHHCDPLSTDAIKRSNLDRLKASKAFKKPRNSLVSKLSYHGSLYEFVLREFVGSFAWEVAWLIFAFAYGLTSTIASWSFCQQPTDDGAGSCWSTVLEMGFGQMVPLVLLLLPFFALLESYGHPKKSTVSENNTADFAAGDSALDTAVPEMGHTPDEPASDVHVNNPPPSIPRAGQLYRDIDLIIGGGDPYETRSIKQALAFVCVYSVGLLTAAGVMSALQGLTGFAIVFALVYLTYFIALSDEFHVVFTAIGKHIINVVRLGRKGA